MCGGFLDQRRGKFKLTGARKFNELPKVSLIFIKFENITKLWEARTTLDSGESYILMSNECVFAGKNRE